MSIPYSNVYDLFLDEISDSTFLQFPEIDRDLILKKLLLKSLSRFKACKTDLLDKDDSLEQFNSDPSDEEQLILSTIMRYHWLNQKVYNIELIKQRMTTKDFKLSSQAEHLLRLTVLKQELDKEISRMIVQYTNYAYSLKNE